MRLSSRHMIGLIEQASQTDPALSTYNGPKTVFDHPYLNSGNQIDRPIGCLIRWFHISIDELRRGG